jgi:ATP-dependent Clp protease, protease subunit
MAKAKDELYKLLEYDIDLNNRLIYIGSQKTYINGESGVDAALSEKVIKAILLMSKSDPEGEKPINIVLNSPGGETSHMFAIYDVLKHCKSKKIITVYGQAMSAGSIILQAGDERILSPHSKIMIHMGTAGYHDHPKILQAWAKESLKVNKEMERVYMKRILEKHPKYKLKDLQKLLDFDTILNAQEAIDLGLADKILGE